MHIEWDEKDSMNYWEVDDIPEVLFDTPNNCLFDDDLEERRLHE